jgi:hypothetical protein
MNEQILCKDCKHSFRLWKDFPNWGNGYEYKCRLAFRPAEVKLDPVVGPIPQASYYERCSIARMSRLSRDVKEDHCGPEGKLWAPKNKKDLFKYIKHVSV